MVNGDHDRSGEGWRRTGERDGEGDGASREEEKLGRKEKRIEMEG